MRKQHNGRGSVYIKPNTLGVHACGLAVHESSHNLCTALKLYTKYTSEPLRAVHQAPSCEQVFIQLSPILSTFFYTFFHLLRTGLYTLSTPPITTRVFSNNHIFINNQGAKA